MLGLGMEVVCQIEDAMECSGVIFCALVLVACWVLVLWICWPSALKLLRLPGHWVKPVHRM